MSPIASSTWPGQLRPYQHDALAAVDARWAQGQRRTWIVLPPGSGKTLVGLEAARRIGRRTVVLVPNTAIQAQWVAHWQAFDGSSTAGTDRGLVDDVNVLTYQSLAVFDPDAETDEEGRSATPVRDRLHANGRALVEALHDARPLTLLLDECHHLLQVWGRLLDEILGDLPNAHVIGLTGTPAESLTATEKELVDRLFGEPIIGASIPALVRDGYLAPFAELAYIARPTALEQSYLAEQSTRFTEMCTDLLAPGFADTDFLPWLDARFVRRTAAPGGHVEWAHLAVREPELTDAVLRMHHAGLCSLPDGARPLEQHRHPPRAEDWIALIGDYARHCLDTDSERDNLAHERLRSALPAVGHHLTRNGVRRGTSSVDRVLARSDAKSHATAEIVAAEHAVLGDRLRALVLCDHERAGSRTPAALRGVLSEDAGSAVLQLSTLVNDPRTTELHPVLVTGRTVSCGPETGKKLLDFLDRPDLTARKEGDLYSIEGPWSSRTWVGEVTRFLEAGHSHVLIGTRALLGEGWDARGINTVVDLTTATTPTAVVQSRGRALRLDPSWPEKTAHTWTVVCVAPENPRGEVDWQRFVRKHQGYLGVGVDGSVMSGVAHVDPSLSPYAPPEDPDALNARMLTRAHDRESTRKRWRIGQPYEDSLLSTLRVREKTAPPADRQGKDLPAPVPPDVLPAPVDVVGPEPPVAAPTTWVLLALAVLCVIVAPWVPLLWPVAAAAAGTAVGDAFLRRWRGARSLLARAAQPVDTGRYACAVADALRATGRSSTGAEHVQVHADTDGVYRYTLTGAGPEAAADFTDALDELLAPLTGRPRYLVPRYVLPIPDSSYAARKHVLAHVLRRPVENTVVFHAVPSSFGRNRNSARAFETAWHRWVCRGEVLFTRDGEGAAVLAAHHGAVPADVTTTHRLVWD